MPRFHFNLRAEAGREYDDIHGHDFPSLADAELAAVRLATRMVAADDEGSCHRWIEIIDAGQNAQVVIPLRSILLLRPD